MEHVGMERMIKLLWTMARLAFISVAVRGAVRRVGSYFECEKKWAGVFDSVFGDWYVTMYYRGTRFVLVEPVYRPTATKSRSLAEKLNKLAKDYGLSGELRFDSEILYLPRNKIYASQICDKSKSFPIRFEYRVIEILGNAQPWSGKKIVLPYSFEVIGHG